MRRSPPGRRANLHPRYDDKPGAHVPRATVPSYHRWRSRRRRRRSPPARIARTDRLTWTTGASLLSVLSSRPVTSPHTRVQQPKTAGHDLLLAGHPTAGTLGRPKRDSCGGAHNAGRHQATRRRSPRGAPGRPRRRGSRPACGRAARAWRRSASRASSLCPC